MIPALLLIIINAIVFAPSAYADMPPPQAELAVPAFGIAAILITVAIVFAGLWFVTRTKRIRKEKELLAAGGNLPSATEEAEASKVSK